MTVSVITQNKIRILLTHTEVITCFGEYSTLYSLGPKVKSSLNLLLNDIITTHSLFNKNCKISAKIKVKENFGCEILLVALLPKRKTPDNECVFEFSDSEALTAGITELYKNVRNFRFLSHLYKTEKGYSLIVNCQNPKEQLFVLHEFCFEINDSQNAVEYTKEYGKPLILNCAIERYGKFFSKRLH